MKILFLDDDPSRHRRLREHIGSEQVEYVWNAAQAIEALQSKTFDVVSLDYDLDRSGDALTGYDVARRLVETPNRDAILLVHSDNPGGARSMLEVLGERATWVSFYDLAKVMGAIRGAEGSR